MQWLALTPEEIAFLAEPVKDDGESALVARLGGRLQATLSARLRLSVGAEPRPAPDLEPAPRPQWDVGAALAELWLARRLGGAPFSAAREAHAVAAYVPPALLRALDAVLAEAWLDVRADLAPALAWEITAAGHRSGLTVRLPDNNNAMTRWAREVIRHG